MTCEIINVGTELLLGNILNTNAKFLSEELSVLGINVYYQGVVGDNENRLSEQISTSLSRCDLLILTGGLGPTEDDITKEVTAKVLDLPLVFDEDSYNNIVEYFKKRKMTPTNQKQAYVPHGSIVLKNNNGTAPGMIIKSGSKHIVILPGPPSELIPMFREYIVPYLGGLTNEVILSKFIKVFGLGESATEFMIKHIIDKQSNPTIAPYAKGTETHLRVTAKSEDKQKAEKLIDSVVDEIKEVLGNSIIAYDDGTLESTLVELLRESKQKISFAESCTCGLLASKIGCVSGASEILSESYITYSNEAKHKILGVSEKTLKEYTEYSVETAKEMAEGLFNLTQANVCISVTGIAGPNGGTKEKPVGTVYIGIHYNGKTICKEFYFKGNRQKIRELSACHAINLARLLLKGEEI